MAVASGVIPAIKTLLRPLKQRMLIAAGRDLHFAPEVAVPTEFHGTEYGGFAILKDSLNDKAVVLSCGIGEDASFDLGLIEKYACTVHAYDPTPKSVRWVQESIRDPRFVFHELAIASTDGRMQLFLPSQENWVSGSLHPGAHTSHEYVDVSSRCLGSVLRDIGATTLDVLKMDIEGAEYSVLADYFNDPSSILPSQIALEFHHFYPEFGLSATREAVRLLRERGYLLCWVSPSNHELLFVSRACVAERKSAVQQ
jgi:FkbM family methyltransferase